MIHKGDKFKVHWVEHETNYVDRLYEVVSVKDGCHCPRPSWLTGLPEKPRAAHCHISARLVRSPLKWYEDGLHWFNDIDPQTLRSITSSDFWLEIVREPGDQLSLF